MTRKDYLEFLVEFINQVDTNQQFQKNNLHHFYDSGLFEYATRHPEIIDDIINKAIKLNAHIQSEKVSDCVVELCAELEVR